jgi:hypothetical protein
VKFVRKPWLSSEQINHARKLIDKGEARQYVADLLNVAVRRSIELWRRRTEHPFNSLTKSRAYTSSVTRRSVLFCLFLALLSEVNVSAQTTQSTAKSSEQNTAENLVRMHEVWGAKASTPNASLAIKESTRTGQVINLRLIADGVPKDGVYSLVTWPVTQKGPSEMLKGATLDSSGLAVCAGKPGTCGSADNPNDPIDVTVQPIPGEPIRLGIVSADGATKVFAKVVPNPLHGDDRGCGSRCASSNAWGRARPNCGLGVPCQ